MKKDFLDSLIAAKSAKHPTVVITELESGAQTLWVDSRTTGDIDINTTLSTAIERALRRDKGETLDEGGKRFFLQPFPPPMVELRARHFVPCGHLCFAGLCDRARHAHGRCHWFGR